MWRGLRWTGAMVTKCMVSAILTRAYITTTNLCWRVTTVSRANECLNFSDLSARGYITDSKQGKLCHLLTIINKTTGNTHYMRSNNLNTTISWPYIYVLGYIFKSWKKITFQLMEKFPNVYESKPKRHWRSPINKTIIIEVGAFFILNMVRTHVGPMYD